MLLGTLKPMKKKKYMEIANSEKNLASKSINSKYTASITNDISQLLFNSFITFFYHINYSIPSSYDKYRKNG